MANDIPWSIRTVLKTEVGTDVDQTVAVAGGNGTIYETPQIAASTTTLIPMSVTTASILGYSLSSDKSCTLKTNSSGSPDDTINLVAGVARVFPGETKALAHDITTGIYVVNGAGAPANVVIHILHS